MVIGHVLVIRLDGHSAIDQFNGNSKVIQRLTGSEVFANIKK